MPVECTDEVLRGIAPAFRHYVQHVWNEIEFGLQKSKVEIERIRTGDEESDAFYVILPYCGKQLKWEVIFDQSAPWFAPDFRFDDETFLLQADSETLQRAVPALAAWDSTNPRALSRLITQLMSLYKEHQKKLLSEDDSSRAYFEYSSLLGDQDSATSESDLEVWVGHGHAAQLLIRLNINTDNLPQLFSDGWDQNPGGECALLLVGFPNSSSPELILSPLVSRAVGNVKLPHMPQSAVLMDYVPMLTEMLNNKIESAIANGKLKREFVSHLVVKHEGAVIEHNAKSAAFLFEVDDFHFILQVEIGDNFPESTPTLTLRSVYHTTKGQPRSKVLAACPYTKLEDYVRQEAEIFRQECTGNAGHSSTVIHIDS